MFSDKQANEWGNGTAAWENASAKDNSWQNPGTQKEKMNMNEGVGGNGGNAYWKQPNPNAVGNIVNSDRRGVGHQNPQQWNNNENVASGSGWDSLPVKILS